MKKTFFKLKGKNGAIFIINTKNWSSIAASLNFYQPLYISAKLLKKSLLLALSMGSWLLRKRLKTAQECQQLLQELLAIPIDFHLTDSCSVLISPTRTKVVVNHHGGYFQKFAVGKSYLKVKNEAEIYALFKEKQEYFQTSTLRDFEDVQSQYCSFKLNNRGLRKNGSPIRLEMALVRFFRVSAGNRLILSTWMDMLLADLTCSVDDAQGLIKIRLKNIRNEYGSTTLPLGLVHNDFKPYNTIQYDPILIFDFEEANQQGLPMMDLFNYYCGPIVEYRPPKEVFKIIMNSEKSKRYTAYKEELNIHLPIAVMLDLYLIERIIFWKKAGEPSTATAYLNLFKFVQFDA